MFLDWFVNASSYATKVVTYLDGKVGHNQLTDCVEAIDFNFKYTIYG